MKKVLLSSAVAFSLFVAAAPVFAEGTASLWVNDIDNNEVPQGSTDLESNKVMDELQAYRNAHARRVGGAGRSLRSGQLACTRHRI